MTDKERVIKGLIACTDVNIVCESRCPYWDQRRCQPLLMDDALALLKEQTKLEPEKVFHMKDRSIINETHGKTGFCPRCNQVVIWEINRRYCGFCGKGLIWDGDCSNSAWCDSVQVRFLRNSISVETIIR